ncbi:hypothetical protein [Streptomyces sp. AC558_RSS880]|uniref:hypothetical protein n=1 Tax=Streptomyces sp. AC558_RSS880 TaxID=2823687 RepID=UPI001C23373A|nr:hypothetical protein [Streptomyces sp. AC558_RSS880]
MNGKRQGDPVPVPGAGRGGAAVVDGNFQIGRAGSSNIPLFTGVPDAIGDTIPDIWTTRSDGSVRFRSGSRTALSGPGTEIAGSTAYWKTRIAVG